MSDYKRGLKSNIWKYYLYELFLSLAFFYPIFQIFYLGRGLTITHIAFLGVTWSVARLLLEIPSGILADRWGRKKTLILASFFFFVQSTIMIFSHDFWLFLVASIAHATFFAFMSGTTVAFFYDTLKELKREKEYEKLWGRAALIYAVFAFIAAFSAGFLFQISDTLPYVLTASSMFISLFVAASFTEPKFHKSAEKDSIFLHFKSSIKKVIRSEYIAFIVIFGALFSFILDFVFQYGQIYLKSISIPIIFFGIIFAFKALFEGVGASLASTARNRFSYRQIFTFILLFTLAIIFSLSYLNNYYGVIVFVIAFFIMGMFRILQRGYIHQRVESYNRATVDSVGSFLIAVIAIILEPIAGRIADIYSIRTSFFVLGCILLVYSVYYFITKFPKQELFNRPQAPRALR